MKLALDQAIDSETSAAGDRITATLLKAVLDSKSGQVLAPEGSRVSGRILRLTRQFSGRPGFVLVLSFDTIEIHDVPSPFHATMEHQGFLVFPASHSTRIVPAGYELEWRTSPVSK